MKKDLDFFLSRVIQNNGCLEWTKCYNTDGYPRTTWNGHSNGKVHRIVYELYNKQDPTGLVVRHTCDNPKCINPNHLLLGTPTDNMRDRDSKGRHGAAKLSHSEVRMIRDLYATGKYKQKDLAIQFKVSYGNINSIVNHNHFKSVI